MERVLRPGGLLFLAFHAGDEIVQVDELCGLSVSMTFFFFQPSWIRRGLENAGFAIEDVVERAPYAPEVEYQSRRAYLLARKPARTIQTRQND
jgi:hypothetical protein